MTLPPAPPPLPLTPLVPGSSLNAEISFLVEFTGAQRRRMLTAISTAAVRGWVFADIIAVVPSLASDDIVVTEVAGAEAGKQLFDVTITVEQADVSEPVSGVAEAVKARIS